MLGLGFELRSTIFYKTLTVQHTIFFSFVVHQQVRFRWYKSNKTKAKTKKTKLKRSMVLLIIRFKSSLVLGILFILVAFRDSINAHTQQALDKKPTGAENGFWKNRRNVVSVDQELFDGVPTASENNKKLGGRKMLVSADNDGKTTVNHENAGVLIGEATTKISGAEHSSAGNTDKARKGNKGGELNVETNKFMSNTDINSKPVNVSLDDSIAVSADYLDPRPHPPKNN